jgi:hypothetical protein
VWLREVRHYAGMTAVDFIAWRNRVGLDHASAAEALGLPADMLERFEDGSEPIPKVVAIASSALAIGPGPWPRPLANGALPPTSPAGTRP